MARIASGQAQLRRKRHDAPLPRQCEPEGCPRAQPYAEWPVLAQQIRVAESPAATSRSEPGRGFDSVGRPSCLASSSAVV